MPSCTWLMAPKIQDIQPLREHIISCAAAKAIEFSGMFSDSWFFAHSWVLTPLNISHIPLLIFQFVAVRRRKLTEKLDARSRSPSLSSGNTLSVPFTLPIGILDQRPPTSLPLYLSTSPPLRREKLAQKLVHAAKHFIHGV